MALIDWQSEFEIGITEVDHEHRELVNLINTLHAEIGGNAEKKIISRFLGEAFAKISAHFALEETVMRKHKYDEYAAHKADHEKLLDDIRDIMEAHESGAFTDYEEALGRAVKDWFVDHFKRKDARLHKMLGV